MRIFIFIFLAFVFCTGCTNTGKKEPYVEPISVQQQVDYVGAESCKECHQKAFEDWKKSDHFYAMQKATKEYVKANFNTSFQADEIQYKFNQNDTAYFVEITEEGLTQNFEVAYTFGWHPLQQYLLKTQNGKFQTLRASWDTEKNEWFHQNAGTIVEPHDWLSWSKGGQNWNTMCSSCHSTHVKKNYNEITDSYNTTFKEVNVACESCHGPGGKHLDFQVNNTGKDPYNNRELWNQKRQIDNCGTCHARRTMLEDLSDPSNQFLHRFIPENLSTVFYEADGQIEGEDFVYGSFLSSRMYRNHVACNNCHNVHSGELQKQGNSLCLQCHDNKTYDTQTHHHHASNTKGAECISCHMDGKTYMGNDYRRDHSFRIPRPDQSVQYGTSNACNSCHKNKDAKWASAAVNKWYGTERAYHFSDDLLPASKLNEKSLTHVKNLLLNDSVPTIIKSTSIDYLKFFNGPDALDLILKSIKNKEALVRQAGYDALLDYPEDIRIEVGLKGLSDPVNSVRIMAFRTVVKVDPKLLDARIAKIWNDVNAEYFTYLKANADFPIGQTLIGEYYQQQNDFTRAEAAFKRALKMDSLLVNPYTNLAILYSGKNDLLAVRGILKQGVQNFPDEAQLYYFIGLNEGTLGNEKVQIENLKRAYLLEPQNIKYAYNYILILYTSGDKEKARKVLSKAMREITPNQRLMELDAYFKSQG